MFVVPNGCKSKQTDHYNFYLIWGDFGGVLGNGVFTGFSDVAHADKNNGNPVFHRSHFPELRTAFPVAEADVKRYPG